MLCCTDLCGTDTTTTSDRDTISAFPGQRRLIPTRGNALRDYNPSIDDVISKPSTALLLVQVPPGTQPGEILHVQIPDENRIIAAQVPPGVDEFHVSYEPMPNTINQSNLMYSPQHIMNHNHPTMDNNIFPPVYTNNTSVSNLYSSSPSLSSPKRVLVQVPEGAPAGSMIQVQVPGENRVIMAQIPPGVREFYVSIDDSSTNPPPMSSYSTTNSRTNRNLPLDTNTTTWNHQQQQQGAQQGSSSNNVGLIAPIVAGAALMGTAAYMMSQHGGSESNDNDYGDDGGDW